MHQGVRWTHKCFWYGYGYSTKEQLLPWVALAIGFFQQGMSKEVAIYVTYPLRAYAVIFHRSLVTATSLTKQWRASRSSCNYFRLTSALIISHSFRLFACNKHGDFTTQGKSFVNIRNSSGLKMQPCGTPRSTSCQVKYELKTPTVNDRIRTTILR